ncbi:hypothetical protein RSJ42_01905 [Methanosarcina hadiensis]|uniref:hypothetical protein n=1 Tax=Methanosarcina hadiensis TaxID=3078083 RepID=UPI0039774029
MINEFFDLFSQEDFSREDANLILNTFFEVIDSEIEKNPELRDFLELYLAKQINETTQKMCQVSQETNQEVQEANQEIKELSKQMSKGLQIIDEIKEKLMFYDSQREEMKSLREKYVILSENSDSLLRLERREFKNIHRFLDQLNVYLDTDFSIVKDLYYNSCWKLGIAYNNYSEGRITYLLYPINYFKNDLQIKEISDKLKDELGGFVETSIGPTNPIHSQPENYAKELVIKKVTEICDKKLLPLSNISLFREVLFGIIDNLHECLGLKVKNSYTVREVRHSFYAYFPIWVDEVLSNENINLGYHPLFSPYIDPAFLLHQLNQEKKEEIDKRVNERIRNCQFNNRNLVLGTRNFPLKLIADFLGNPSLNDFNEINRLYIPKNFDRPTISHYSWSHNTPEEVLENIKIFFNEFPNVYDTTIDYCFPKLKQELRFFNDFDTLIVVIEVHDNYTNNNNEYSTWCPLIKYYYLRAEESNTKKEIKIFMKDRDHIPINREMDFKSKIWIDGKSYTIVKSKGPGMLGFIFDRLPMFDYLYKTLSEKMSNFFVTMDN